MEEKKSRIEELFAGYFSRSLLPEEEKELRDWVSLSSDNRKQFLMMREIWFSSIGASDNRRFNKDVAYQRFLARTDKASTTAHHSNTWRILLQSAAAIAALIAVSLVSFWQGGKQVMRLAGKNLPPRWHASLAQRRIQAYLFARVWHQRAEGLPKWRRLLWGNAKRKATL